MYLNLSSRSSPLNSLSNDTTRLSYIFQLSNTTSLLPKILLGKRYIFFTSLFTLKDRANSYKFGIMYLFPHYRMKDIGLYKKYDVSSPSQVSFAWNGHFCYISCLSILINLFEIFFFHVDDI